MELKYNKYRKHNIMQLILLVYAGSIFINGDDNLGVNKKVLQQPNECTSETCMNANYNENVYATSTNNRDNTGETIDNFQTFNENKNENLDILDIDTNQKAHNEDNVSLLFNNSILNNETVFFRTKQNSLYDIIGITETNNQYSEKKEETNTISGFNSSESFIKPTTKSLPTLPPSNLFLFENSSKGIDICFCDLKVNECDINCCCDKDCAEYHWKVFTKCKDENVQYDSKYCYKNNLFFFNNSKNKIIKNEGGLFCIIKNNSPVTSYKSKNIITSLDSFHKYLPKTMYSFFHNIPKNIDFKSKKYQVGSFIWTVNSNYNEFKPFKIPVPTVGFLCTSYLNIRYLIDKETVCAHSPIEIKKECGNSKSNIDFRYLAGIKIISNPSLVNISDKFNLSKLCENGACIGISVHICQFSDSITNCIKITEPTENFQKFKCWKTASKIYYYIWHNGTEGIKKFSVYFWLKNESSNLEDNLFQMTKVKFFWKNSSNKTFQRSGNPGYLIGKPILAGRKIYNTTNGTAEKREAIEMSLYSKDWLSVLGSEKGICSLYKRLPINFGENGQYTCSLVLPKNNFGKENCTELQNYIYNFLIGNDIENATVNNYFNKFVATFGNSEVEKTEDWVQVLFDLFPILSSQVGFKSNYNSLICKNMITDLYIDIVYANVGSFHNPQAKILGVRFHFGEHRDLVFHCNKLGCENNNFTQNFKLSTMVHFIDTTEPAEDAFAQSLGLELKLPHDFFYPFFSKAYQCKPFIIYVFMFFILKISQTKF